MEEEQQEPDPLAQFAGNWGIPVELARTFDPTVARNVAGVMQRLCAREESEFEWVGCTAFSFPATWQGKDGTEILSCTPQTDWDKASPSALFGASNYPGRVDALEAAKQLEQLTGVGTVEWYWTQGEEVLLLNLQTRTGLYLCWFWEERCDGCGMG